MVLLKTKCNELSITKLQIKKEFYLHLPQLTKAQIIQNWTVLMTQLQQCAKEDNLNLRYVSVLLRLVKVKRNTEYKIAEILRNSICILKSGLLILIDFGCFVCLFFQFGFVICGTIHSYPSSLHFVLTFSRIPCPLAHFRIITFILFQGCGFFKKNFKNLKKTRFIWFKSDLFSID